MTSIPKVSIILCTYNRASLLSRAISSVLRQTTKEWELIIIDDGSTDNTRVLVQQFLSLDSRIRYYYQRNKGLAGARNTGLKKCRGEWITFIDSDDEYRNDHLAKRITFVSAHPDIDFLHGGVKLIGPRQKHYVVDLTDRSKKIHLTRCHIGGTFFFKKKILKRVQEFRKIPFGEDFNFFERVKKTFSVKKILYPTYLYHLDVANRLCDLFTEELLQVKRRKKNT